MATRFVDVLTFEGCPHAEPAVVLAERVVRELGADAEVLRIDVPDTEAAERERFRVDGRDIEPGAENRTGFALSCRVYGGSSGQLQERWLRDALTMN